MFNCPQCGCETETFDQGVCIDCCEANQLELDMHNAEYDWWNSLTSDQKDNVIDNQH